jgi:hypothetical protein
MSEATANHRPRVRWNWRVAGIVVLLLATIAAAVVIVDSMAIRNRDLAPPTTAPKK